MHAVGTDNLYRCGMSNGLVLTGHCVANDTFDGQGQHLSVTGTFASINQPNGGKVKVAGQ
jgi:hypothetical protein